MSNCFIFSKQNIHANLLSHNSPKETKAFFHFRLKMAGPHEEENWSWVEK
jgi:hypothetical protein